jgi:glyoxylate/hydroxypyruvate reductase
VTDCGTPWIRDCGTHDTIAPSRIQGESVRSARQASPLRSAHARVTVRVLIASPLEAELVARIAAVDRRLEVAYRADLIGTPRYAGDHTPPVQRSAAQEAEWVALLASAEVLFDVDRPNVRAGLPARAPSLRWVQASSSGVGEWIRRLGLVDAPVQVTNASGIHAAPLAEFVVFAMLHFAKRMPLVQADRAARRWERFAGGLVRGRTVGVIGFGRVGQEIARLSRAVGVRVIGLRRTPGTLSEGVERVYGPEGLHELLAESDYVVLIAPYTPETDTLLGRDAISHMKPGAVLINIARGNLVDEAALIEALQKERLAGAALDVFRQEPLPADSPFWDLPNVLITPHSMSTAVGENELLVDLFCDNLRRYLGGQPLRNLVDKQRGY